MSTRYPYFLLITVRRYVGGDSFCQCGSFDGGLYKYIVKHEKVDEEQNVDGQHIVETSRIKSSCNRVHSEQELHLLESGTLPRW